VKKFAIKAGIAISLTGLLAGCASITAPFSDPDPRWADYKNWTKVTADEVSTGNPTGFLGGVHQGDDGYRDVYVNDIAKDTLYGSAPYNYPEGSVIVKEQYASKEDWEARRKVSSVQVVILSPSCGLGATTCSPTVTFLSHWSSGSCCL